MNENLQSGNQDIEALLSSPDVNKVVERAALALGMSDDAMRSAVRSVLELGALRSVREVSKLGELLNELQQHEAKNNGPWTHGMRRRVNDALNRTGRNGREV